MTGPYLDTLDEVSTVHGLNWSDDSKLLLLDRFLQEETRRSPGLNERFDKFLEQQAEDELLGADEDEEADDGELDAAEIGGESG